MIIVKRIVHIAAVIILTVVPNTAFAQCANPPGVEGEQVYNSTHKVMQYCDGADWTAMRATSKAEQTALDALSATVNGKAEQTDLDALSATVNGKVDKAGDTMSGTLTLSGPPISNFDAATKSYVDTVLAAGGGGSSSGTAGTCYYSNANCGQGFAQMPGVYRPGSNNHNICCSSGFFAQDTVPNTYDISDAEMAGGQVYQSSIFQISGITTATINVSGEGSPEYRLCNNSNCTDILSNWKSTSQTVYESQYYQVRSTAPSTSGTHTATLSIGDGSDSWVLTVPATPTAIAFADVSEVSGSTVESSIQQVTGIYSADVSIDAGEFRICGNSSCSNVIHDWGTGDKVIMNNQYIQMRGTAPTSGNETMTLTIGGTDVPWNVSAVSAPTGISINHTNGSSRIYITMTGGTNVGICDVLVGSYDIADIDCDQNWSNQLLYMSQGMYQTGNWNGLPVKLVAKTNSYDSGSIGTVSCTVGGAGSPDNLDNNCNGIWDEPVKTNIVTLPINSATVSAGACSGQPVSYTSAYKYCTDWLARQNGGWSGSGSYVSTPSCYWNGVSWTIWSFNYSGNIECYNVSGYN